MILCPRCGGELSADQLSCAACGAVRTVEGVVDFTLEADAGTGDYNPAWFEQLDRVEACYFWFRARRAVILDMFRRHVPRSSRVIEIGTGTGNVAAALAADGYNVAVSDVHLEALRYAGSKGLSERYRFDIMRPPFHEHFDVIGLFDVLEHIDDDTSALAGIRAMLRSNGLIILTVPAHQRLWNQSDVTALHKRRYGVAELRRKVEAAGFKVLESRGFFISLLPLLALRALVSPARAATRSGQSEELTVVPVANAVLNAMLTIERRLLGCWRAPLGGSIALVARKTTDTAPN